MIDRSRRVLIACYGGGHVQSLIPLARALQNDPEVELTVIGFTTARIAFERAGIKVLSYAVFEQYLLYCFRELISPFVGSTNHPDVSEDDTRAYYHVGLHDLIELHGKEEALRQIEQQGRVAFHPEATFTRYLEATQPDLVITSTSPRSELALQRAARLLAIPGLAVSDLFLQHEASYLCDEKYAPHISVIADYVADFLRGKGCTHTKLYVTGNPAFDALFGSEARHAGEAIRKEFGFDEKKRLLTWIGTPHEVSLRGKRFVDSQVIMDRLEAFCSAHPDHRFAFRPHPNRPVELPHGCQYGVLLGSEFSIEEVLWASDAVLLETSTVGLQAALIGRPVITLAAENYPPYSELGLATDVADLEALESVLHKPRTPRLDQLGPAGLGDATDRVLQVVYQLLRRDSDMVVGGL